MMQVRRHVVTLQSCLQLLGELLCRCNAREGRGGKGRGVGREGEGRGGGEGGGGRGGG